MYGVGLRKVSLVELSTGSPTSFTRKGEPEAEEVNRWRDFNRGTYMTRNNQCKHTHNTHTYTHTHTHTPHTHLGYAHQTT